MMEVVSGDNWSCKTCKAPVKSPPTNQHPVRLPPRLPLRLVYTQKYLNVFECTQPYFVLLQETLTFFSLLSRGA